VSDVVLAPALSTVVEADAAGVDEEASGAVVSSVVVATAAGIEVVSVCEVVELASSVAVGASRGTSAGAVEVAITGTGPKS